jgi:cysteine desulfurase
MPYFDHMATNPLRAEVLDSMMPYLKEEFGNPLAIYPLGQRAREALEEARAKVADLIKAKPQEVIFTASGAESNNMALRGLAHANSNIKGNKGKHIIVSKMEHHSILNPARILEKEGFAVTYLPVDRDGLVDPEQVEKAITDETILISIIHASPEVGTIEPVAEIAQIAKKHKVLMHTDAVASAGNIPVEVDALRVDALSLSAHQFYGPKGAGALYLKGGTRIMPLIYGGIQESGRRAGTENVPAIVGMGKAAELAQAEMAEKVPRLFGMKEKIRQGVLNNIPNVIYTGHPERRLPGHASFCVEFIEGEAMLLMLGAKKIYAASGSACSSKALKASPVLLSMGIPTHLAHGSVVFSLGGDNTEEEVDYLLAEFPKIVERLREMSPYGKGWGGLEERGQCIPKN